MPARIGHVRAFALFALGEPLSGAEAVALGIANAALPAGDVDAAALAAARTLASKPASAVAATKRLMRDAEAIRAAIGGGSTTPSSASSARPRRPRPSPPSRRGKARRLEPRRSTFTTDDGIRLVGDVQRAARRHRWSCCSMAAARPAMPGRARVRRLVADGFRGRDL